MDTDLVTEGFDDIRTLMGKLIPLLDPAQSWPL